LGGDLENKRSRNVVRENWTQGLCAGRSRRQALCGSAIPNLG
jgi:hypothetical protein